jgi:hypothetical protein
MISRRTWLRLISLLGLLTLLLGAYAYLGWNRLLERQQISELDWQGLSLSLDGIDLAQLSLRQAHNRLQVEQLQLGWSQLRIERLSLSLLEQAPVETSPDAEPSLSLAQLSALLTQLPDLRIAHLAIQLPCAEQRCSLLGDLQLLHKAPSSAEQTLNLDLQLNLTHQQHQLNWSAQLQGAASALELQLGLAIDQLAQLTLNSSLRDSPAGPLWRGNLSTRELSQALVLQSWLGQWLPAAGQGFSQTPAAAQLLADWHLQLPPGPLSLAQLQQASGQLSASAKLPEPWPVPAIGQLQGQFSLTARALDGLWFADKLNADLQLSQISSTALPAVPASLRPDSLQLRIAAAEQLDSLAESLRDRALPLVFSLSSQGRSPFELHGTLALANAAPWALQLVDGKLEVKSSRLKFDAWNLRDLQAQLTLSGYMDEQQLSLKLGKGSQLQLGQVQGGELRIHKFKVASDDLQLNAQHQAGTLQGWQLQGPANINLQRLEQLQLKPQGWHWQGQLAATEQQATLDGTLNNDAELKLSLQLQHSSATGLRLQAQLPELFLRSGNPLQQTLSAWPALLELSDGRLHAKANLSLPSLSGAPSVQLELSGKGLAGIYDRSALTGLDSTLSLQLDPRQLHIELSELRLQQANPGVPLGPLQLSGSYQAPLAQAARGQLQIRQASSALLGGQVQLAPGQWDLAQGELLLPLNVQGLELEQLFILYPTEGLAGTGTLDGVLPLRIGSAGVTIEQGQLNARQPGGQLQFHSERIRALGRSNPAMQLVAQSLEDFRYATLSSQVNYDQGGKLKLGIRLQGQNPAIEQGRPIHFNINLEEDIPSLLASLQLTGKVGEIIQRRVQQRMLERNAKPAPQEP